MVTHKELKRSIYTVKDVTLHCLSYFMYVIAHLNDYVSRERQDLRTTFKCTNGSFLVCGGVMMTIIISLPVPCDIWYLF